MKIGKENVISKSATIPSFVEIGHFNIIGENVLIQAAAGAKNPKLLIGDCNIINENVKIIVGDEGVFINDWNVIHNNILIIGESKIEIGHNCWFGQNTILDGSGGLFIRNGVRVGMFSQIWTHVASGEQIEGCTLFLKRPTIIENDVWLVGSCIVGSGLTLGRRSICLINSVLTKDTQPSKVYSGTPAKLMELNFYKDVTLMEKFELMNLWATKFAENNDKILISYEKGYLITIKDDLGDMLVFGTDISKDKFNSHKKITFFNMVDKTFNKKNLNLERTFYKYIYNNKARFTPYSFK